MLLKAMFFYYKYKEYGHLSNRTLDEMISGSRIEVAKIKNPGDFTLWNHLQKKYPVGESLGNRKPGWHIECSAMSKISVSILIFMVVALI